MSPEYYLYKPDSDAVIKTIGSEEQGWRYYFVLTKVSPTPTNTPSTSIGATPSQTPTQTPTISLTRTQTPTPTQTATATPTRTPNSTPGITPSNSSTPAVTPTSTPTQSNPAPTATPSSTPNATCGDTFVINGPWDCSALTQAMCYQANSSNNVTVYSEATAGLYISEGKPLYTDSNCTTLLSTNGFYVLQVVNTIGVEGQIMYVQNGHVLYYLGGCSSLAYQSCYICNGSSCDFKTDPITVGQSLLQQKYCEIAYNICGSYITYYCECEEPVNPQDSPCCADYAYGGPYSQYGDCAANCPP